MEILKTMTVIAIVVFAGSASAANYNQDQNGRDYAPRQDLFEYARVVETQPIYHEVRVSKPVRECWEQPVYHTRNKGRKSAGGMLAGGLIGGIVGHQIGGGSGNKIATAVGTLVGAKIGHEAINGHVNEHSSTVASYEEHCKTSHRVSYEEVVDGYDVTYHYRGRSYHVEMPYDPGERIKMRIQFTPVI